MSMPDTRVIPIHLVRPGGAYTPDKLRLFVVEIAEGLRRRFPDRP